MGVTLRNLPSVYAAILILLPHPHIVFMTTRKPRRREQAKTKAELQEMLAKAVRNTQPQAEPELLPKPKKRPRPRS
jgi:hypothetical protein